MKPYMRTLAVAFAAVAAICVSAQNKAPNAPGPNSHTTPPPTVKVSGKVIDQAKRPLAGVKIVFEYEKNTSIGGPHTDASGNYGVNAMRHDRGMYLLTPVLSGYQFTPKSATVSATNGGTANFKGTADGTGQTAQKPQ
jgi:hypothetical protein